MDGYAKIKTVGRGAYGVVQLVRRKRDNKLVIIKEIPVEEMTYEERQAALNEVNVLDMLNHPNIISYFDSFFEEKALMIVMEYAEGGTIFEFLQSRNGELLDEKEIMHYFVQMVLSLKAIHRNNILHRDLKTQNIMLDRSQRVVKIGDFGISKVLSSKSKANTVVGTPCYISPELCEGRPYDEKSDIWALGCVLYEMCSLRKAFDAANLPALVLKIMRGTFSPVSDAYSKQLKDLILSVLHQDPHQRPTLNEILALPVCQNALVNLHTDIGRLPFFGATASGSDAGSSGLYKSSDARREGSAQSRGPVPEDPEPVNPLKIVVWGLGLAKPMRLHGYKGDGLVGLHISRSQLLAVSGNGGVRGWKSSHVKQVVRSTAGDPDWLPTRVPNLEGVVVEQIACGASFSIFRSDRGIVMSCGNGSDGCLGHGDYDDSKVPRIVQSLLELEVTHISAGATHVAATTRDGDVYTWGCGDKGRLGLGHDEGTCVPHRVKLPDGVRAVSTRCADDVTFVITTERTLYACGSNRHNKAGLSDSYGMLGRGDKGGVVSAEEAHSFLLVKAPAVQGAVVDVAAGVAHTAILTAEGLLFTFGSNGHGQLGRQTSPANPPEKPSLVSTLQESVVEAISCGDNFTVAVTADLEVWGWGKTAEGRLAQPMSKSGLATPTRLSAVEEGLGVGKKKLKIKAVTSRYHTTLLAVQQR